MEKHYAGIGSRTAPNFILERIESVGYALAGYEYVLNSGAADGCDAAFERGARMNNGQCDIFLPWPRFNNHFSTLNKPVLATGELVRRYHPAYNKLSPAAHKLHRRNIHQILGEHLNEPVQFVICYTDKGQIKGGTATAINCALDHGIPVFNLGAPDYIEVKANWLVSIVTKLND